ncbi:CYTH domain-containing protein [Cellulomonas algicola]|uniref:Adenylate cyclase n=1 Tax=Cellulomonas algicola TaxID=2071633 RepID=A0A401V1J9_9CELL|nr:CYTH domain-containing protein [Cellulomonas algicola]GCD20785.1 adenylate cyclase [Cellulomonas algicola]
MREIERKFLLASVPDGTGRWVRVRQGYLAQDARAAVRVREVAGRFWLTCKRGEGIVREEWEVELSAAQWEQLWPATGGARVEKDRGRVDLDGAVAVVDVFDGPLAGLRLAEVEFPTRASAHAFVPPPWVGAEVTDDPRYGNRSLAVRGLPVPG